MIYKRGLCGRGKPGLALKGAVGMLGFMNSPDEKAETVWHQIGSFEPREAKRLLEALEKAGVPFEIEYDDSALQRPMRTVELYLAMNPEGAKLAIFVPEENVGDVQVLVRALFPV